MRSSGAPCLRSTSRMRSSTRAPTVAAPRWMLAISAFRDLRQISALKLNVGIGFVTGIKPRTTPIGLATSRIAPFLEVLSSPHDSRPSSEARTFNEPKRILTILCSTTPMPVSCTVSRARLSARSAIVRARSLSSAMTRSSGQSANSCCARSARPTISSTQAGDLVSATKLAMLSTGRLGRTRPIERRRWPRPPWRSWPMLARCARRGSRGTMPSAPPRASPIASLTLNGFMLQTPVSTARRVGGGAATRHAASHRRRGLNMDRKVWQTVRTGFAPALGYDLVRSDHAIDRSV